MVKLKKPERFTVENLERVFKKAGVKKILRDVSIGDGNDD